MLRSAAIMIVALAAFVTVAWSQEDSYSRGYNDGYVYGSPQSGDSPEGFQAGQADADDDDAEIDREYREQRYGYEGETDEQR